MCVVFSGREENVQILVQIKTTHNAQKHFPNMKLSSMFSLGCYKIKFNVIRKCFYFKISNGNINQRFFRAKGEEKFCSLSILLSIVLYLCDHEANV